MVDVAKSVIDPKTSIDENLFKVSKAIEDEAGALEGLVLTKNAAIPKKEVISRLTKLERAPEIV
jgi:hypothetical protein